MEWMILSHLPTRSLEEGFIPAAIGLNVGVTIFTDCIQEHVLRKESVSVYQHCKLLECDIFNPLSIARLLAIHSLNFSGILATAPGLQPCAAILSDYCGLAGPSWHSALLCSQKNVLRNRLNFGDRSISSRIIHTADPQSENLIEHFPAIVQSLEPGADNGGLRVSNAKELRACLDTLCEGLVLVENFLQGYFYTLESLCTPDGFTVLGGSCIRIEGHGHNSTRRRHWIANPPHQKAVVDRLSELNLGVGRHHVEYVLTDQGLRILDIYNGLNSDEEELSLNDQLNGDLFRETLHLCLGIPSSPLQWQQASNMTDAMEVLA